MLRNLLRRVRRSHADKPKAPKAKCSSCVILLAALASLPLIVLLVTSVVCKTEMSLEADGALASSVQGSALCKWRRSLSSHQKQVDQAQPSAAAKLGTPSTPWPPPLSSMPPISKVEAGALKQQLDRQEAAAAAASAAAAVEVQHHGTHGIEDVVLPKTDADIERIMKFPHVHDCNLCQVCVPHHVVAQHPKAQQKEKELSHILGTGDLLEAAMQAGTGRRARRSSLKRHSRRLQHDSTASGLRQAATTSSAAWSPLMGSSALGLYSTYGSTESVAGIEGSHSHQGSSSGGTHDALQAQGRSLKELDAIESDGIYQMRGKDINISDIAPGPTRAPFRTHLPNCTVCWGCKHTLEPMASGDILFDSYYAHEPGGSPSWLFQVRTNKTESGWAVVKTWCVPVMKVKQRGFAMCSPRKVYTQVKLLLAQQQITAKCGLNEIVPKLWIEPLHGVLPGHGFRVDWLGLWFDTADGVSVQNIQESGKPPAKPQLIIDLFQNNINHTEIKLASIFDLLFSQCDRHQQNIFMTEKGQLRIIDNDQVYATAWRKCGIDSMLIPTTQKFMINHLGFFYVLKYPHKDPGPPTTWSETLNPLMLLDYRCHVDNGTIGKAFPPQVQQCMQGLAAMTAEQIHWQYGYPALRMADAIRNRSMDMLAHGYEWTLLHGQPTNQAMHRYKVAPSCCKMSFDTTLKEYVCESPGYHQMSEIPFGNPWHGGKWHGTPGKDTGTYDGDEVFRIP